MNKIPSTFAVTFVMVSLTTAVFAADTTKPVIPAPPIVASQPPAADAAAKIKTDRLLERNKRARATSGSVKKAVVAPASPAVKATATKRVKKLQERNLKARENTKAMNITVPKETAPVAPAIAK
ncbi:MAG: hypothetical protein H7X83_13495 [Verrucomicrobia bacterium]|nr:hypothetical protein [Deltaproteobacteria bacterium]